MVGAGVAGLLAARDLDAAGATVTVLDKGRGVGGRLATRRIGTARFDHGAQFLTARSAPFAAEVAAWSAAGTVVPWFEGVLGADGIVVDDGEVRHRGAPTMTAVAKALAGGLDVRTASRVATAGHQDGRWEVGLVDGATVAADAVVLTAPVPQVLALLDPDVVDPVDRLALERITYEPCLAVLAVLDRSPGSGAPGARRPSGEPVAFYVDNQAKGVSSIPAVTVHAGPATSSALFDAPEGEVVDAVLGGLDLGGAVVLDAQVQRWRYAQATVAHPEPCLALRGAVPAVVAGDAFGDGGRIEGAALSGMAAARVLAERLGLG